MTDYKDIKRIPIVAADVPNIDASKITTGTLSTSRYVDNNTTYSVQDGELSENNFADADHTKLNGIATSANNYSHPTTAGNKHIPSGGATDQVLTYSSSGTASWADPAAGGVDGITSSADATAITIDSSERVGVGATTPPYTLTVRETSTSAGTYYPIGVCGANHQTGYGVGIAFRPENQAVSQKAKVGIISEGTSGGNNKATLHIALSDTANTTTEVSLADSVLEFTMDGRAVSEFTAKAWVNFNGASPFGVNDSHNVTDVTDNGTGDYTINFTNALANANYSVSSLGTHESANSAPRNICFKSGNTKTTSTVQITNEYYNGSLADGENVEALIFGA